MSAASSALTTANPITDPWPLWGVFGRGITTEPFTPAGAWWTLAEVTGEVRSRNVYVYVTTLVFMSTGERVVGSVQSLAVGVEPLPRSRREG